MKIRLVHNSKKSGQVVTGMDLYRLMMNYIELQGEFEILVLGTDDFDSQPLDGDVYIFNRGKDLFRTERVKREGKILIVDLDDYFQVPTWHLGHIDNIKKRLDYCEENKERVGKDAVLALRIAYQNELNAKDNSIASCKMADLVVCATPRLQKEVDKIGVKKSVVVKNTIHPSVQMFSEKKSKSHLVRFGWVGGAYHGRDVSLMYDGIRRLYNDKDEAGKFQFVSSFNETFEYKEIEKFFTLNYSQLPQHYANYLQQYTRIGSHIGNDMSYKRIWNLPVMEYGYMYEQIDVALIPLHHGKFNNCKSELKLIEAGKTGCVAIVSDVLPYSPYLKHMHNCFKIDKRNGWYAGFKILLNNEDLRETLKDNLKKTIAENFDSKIESNTLRENINLLKSAQ